MQLWVKRRVKNAAETAIKTTKQTSTASAAMRFALLFCAAAFKAFNLLLTTYPILSFLRHFVKTSVKQALTGFNGG
jgi:hypothetical protein